MPTDNERAKVLIPETLRDEVSALPEYTMGLHRVTVLTRDGRTFTGVDIAWGMEVVRVEGADEIPFGGDDIVAVAADRQSESTA